MTIHYTDDQVTLHHGDCLVVLATLPDCSVDSVVCDPPYDLVSGAGGFMGKAWDATGIAFRTDVWLECLRVLKPGGHVLAFGGTRTWHRLASAIEDSGFEIRDSIAWLYGSGFPKSMDVSKAIDKAAGAQREVVGEASRPDGSTRVAALGGAMGTALAGSADGTLNTNGAMAMITAPATDLAKQWQGWGTALKPAFEPIVVGRKPIQGTVARNVTTHGTGALNIDACRVGTTVETWPASRSYGTKGKKFNTYAEQDAETQPTGAAPAGRWPANVVLDGDMADLLDQQSGKLHSQNPATRQARKDYDSHAFGSRSPGIGYGDSGGASRFFPTFRYQAKAPGTERPTANGTAHPTVKPVDLLRWLVRLVTPPGGIVLDPFAGSGTTAEACIHEHMRAIVIEREPDYLPLIVARLSKPMAIGFDFESEGA